MQPGRSWHLDAATARSVIGSCGWPPAEKDAPGTRAWVPREVIGEGARRRAAAARQSQPACRLARRCAAIRHPASQECATGVTHSKAKPMMTEETPAKFDRELLNELARGAQKVLENAEALFFRGEDSQRRRRAHRGDACGGCGPALRPALPTPR